MTSKMTTFQAAVVLVRKKEQEAKATAKSQDSLA